MNVAMSAMISIVVLVSNATCLFAQKSVRQDANVLLEHMKIDLDSVFQLVTKLSVQWSKNVQTIKFGICAETAARTFIAVRTKNVFLHHALPDAILVVNVPVECTQVRGISIYV